MHGKEMMLQITREICASQCIIFNLRSQLFSQNMHTLETISTAPYLFLPKLVQILSMEFQRMNTRKEGLRIRHKDPSEYDILALL